ncbi:resistin [Crotalus tigris]|uniref:resistin n=1 Tax=Crotalus tigris TaxID=88082 RepID=UPI00192F9008|nr:resistin [Crotalus tigris]XP_039215481.1 resistin [Crotalus tigris]XP_039215482.1 resistin [Crotalus tigris]
MKKLFIFLLFTLLLSEKYANAQTCEIDSVIELKTKNLIASAVSSALSKMQLTCQSVSGQGAFAVCPSGFIPTSCACGMACGSWDIRQNSVCHCQCARIDWTSAQCCKISVGS